MNEDIFYEIENTYNGNLQDVLDEHTANFDRIHKKRCDLIFANRDVYLNSKPHALKGNKDVGAMATRAIWGSDLHKGIKIYSAEATECFKHAKSIIEDGAKKTLHRMEHEYTESIRDHIERKDVDAKNANDIYENAVKNALEIKNKYIGKINSEFDEKTRPILIQKNKCSNRISETKLDAIKAITTNHKVIKDFVTRVGCDADCDKCPDNVMNQNGDYNDQSHTPRGTQEKCSKNDPRTKRDAEARSNLMNILGRK